MLSEQNLDLTTSQHTSVQREDITNNGATNNQALQLIQKRKNHKSHQVQSPFKTKTDQMVQSNSSLTNVQGFLSDPSLTHNDLMNQSLDISQRQSNADSTYKREMMELRESKLITRTFLWVLPWFLILALGGSYFPFIQALVPVHESDSCLCVFYFDSEHGSWFPLLNALQQVTNPFDVLSLLNLITFYCVNWIFLMVNMWYVFRIRKMDDRLLIRKEMTYVVIVWLIFDSLQYIFYGLSQQSRCQIQISFLKHAV